MGYTVKIWLIIVTFSLGLQDPTAPQTEDQPAAASEFEQPMLPREGIWPSSTLLKSLLTRWADEASARVELNDDQRDQFREAILERWTDYLDQQRDVLQPLANELVEMRMAVEPPAPDKVRSWAERALPAFESVRQQLRGSQDDFRELLTPVQRAKYELEVLKRTAGLELVEHKLKSWREGKYEKDELWEPLPAERRARRAERKRPNDVAGDAAPSDTAEPTATEDQILIELTAWEKYMADFIERFTLDDGQRSSVLSLLKEMQERAMAHREHYRTEIAALEARIAGNSGGPQELNDIKRQLIRLYGPIDEMFQELKTRSEKVLNAEQRARLHEAEQPGEQSEDDAPPGK